MARLVKKTSPAKHGKAASAQSRPQVTRLWLMYPPKLIQRPIVWELAKKFDLVTNIRQASVTDEIGIVSLELQGERATIKGAIRWLEHLGVSVEPVEINVIES